MKINVVSFIVINCNPITEMDMQILPHSCTQVCCMIIGVLLTGRHSLIGYWDCTLAYVQNCNLGNCHVEIECICSDWLTVC